VPNAFSPNDDGRNDLFLPYFDPNYSILDFELKVFDRWGGLVFASEDPKEGWNGKIKGQKADTALFVYLLQFTYKDQSEYFEQMDYGEVNLIR
ncbi:MAG: gliding motility-associated C-terminal domain-containing protein, partial [Phaeodactylibacter sp.]|nr:gliding motility-associated C-terminal domain-containing protein [Phaeodactylibacter sp.]